MYTYAVAIFTSKIYDMFMVVGEIRYRRAGKLLAMIWTDKRDVKVLCTFHDTYLALTGKMDRQTAELPVMKPKFVLEYKKWMGGVDTSDMMTSSYAIL